MLSPDAADNRCELERFGAGVVDVAGEEEEAGNALGRFLGEDQAGIGAVTAAGDRGLPDP
ncbi:hypothetical protein D3C86_1967410 [compost metagenome]